MKRKKEIRKLLKDNTIFIDEKKKEETIHILQNESNTIKIATKISSIDMMLNQLGYLSRGILIFQLILFIIGVGIVYSMNNHNISIPQLIIIFSCISSSLGVISVVEANRSYCYHMWEIENSCKLSLSQITAIRILLSSGISLLIITILVMLLGTFLRYSVFLLGIYLLIPFMITNIVAVQTFKHVRNRMVEIGILIGMVCFHIIFNVIISEYHIYEMIYTTIWLLVFSFIVCIFIRELIVLIGQMKGKGKIWNLE